MDKEKILIRRISNYTIAEKWDETAVEDKICIRLKNGKTIDVTCSPSHREEMILGDFKTTIFKFSPSFLNFIDMVLYEGQ